MGVLRRVVAVREFVLAELHLLRSRIALALFLDLFCAHLRFVRGSAAFGLVFAVVGPTVFALLIVPGVLRWLVTDLRGGSEIEVLEQLAGYLCIGRLVVDGQRQRIQLNACLLLDPRRDQVETQAGRKRRSVPRQSLAGEQPDRGGKRHFIGASGAQDGIAADPRFGQLRKIAPYAIHRPRTECLDPGDFQSVEHGAGIGVERHRGKVQPLVVMPQPKRDGIGRAPRFRDELWLE